jgi:hypothetical protein
MTEPYCLNLFEDLLSRIDKPYDYNYLIAKILCRLLDTQAQQSIFVVGGVPYFYDPARGKYLSLARPIIRAGAYGEGVTSRYLRIEDVAASGLQGFFLPRAATVTGLWAKSRSTAPWVVEVRRNGIALTIVSETITGGSGGDANIDMDLDAGDWVQVFALGTNIEHIVAAVEIAWRTTV